MHFRRPVACLDTEPRGEGAEQGETYARLGAELGSGPRVVVGWGCPFQKYGVGVRYADECCGSWPHLTQPSQAHPPTLPLVSNLVSKTSIQEHRVLGRGLRGPARVTSLHPLLVVQSPARQVSERLGAQRLCAQSHARQCTSCSAAGPPQPRAGNPVTPAQPGGVRRGYDQSYVPCYDKSSA